MHAKLSDLYQPHPIRKGTFPNLNFEDIVLRKITNSRLIHPTFACISTFTSTPDEENMRKDGIAPYPVWLHQRVHLDPTGVERVVNGSSGIVDLPL